MTYFSTTTQTYRDSAQFYDLEMAHQQRTIDEASFYAGCARTANGPLLELACRSGRLTLPMARAGVHVHALDRSPAMLRLLQTKLDAAEPAVAARIQLHRGDLAAFDLGRRFDLIVLPFRAFNHLLSDSGRRRCLATIRRHLGLGGTFIVDLFNHQPLAIDWFQGELTEWQGSDPATCCHITKTMRLGRIDLQQKIIYPEVTYYVTRPAGGQEVFRESLPLAYLSAADMRQLLAEAGFRIHTEMGYFDGRPIGHGSELIFVCS